MGLCRSYRLRFRSLRYRRRIRSSNVAFEVAEAVTNVSGALICVGTFSASFWKHLELVTEQLLAQRLQKTLHVVQRSRCWNVHSVLMVLKQNCAGYRLLQEMLDLAMLGGWANWELLESSGCLDARRGASSS